MSKKQSVSDMVLKRETKGKMSNDDKKVISQRLLVSSVEKNAKQIEELAEKLSHLESAPSMKKGGVVKKTGLHNLHKGEVVISKKDVDAMKKKKK